MQTPNDAIAYAVATSKMIARRFADDLAPAEYLHRPTPKANCAAWLLGHLTLTNRQAARVLGAADLPHLPDGFEKRFARDETAPCASDFGDVSGLLSVFEQSCDTLSAAARRATDEQLNRPLEKHPPMFSTAGEMALFMAIHTAMHVGQITTIRRSLGRPPII